MPVLLTGLFGVPLALLVLGHRIRRRGPTVRRAFAGAVAGHCVAACLAVTVGMIPPEAWTSDETVRGLAGVWSLVAAPLVGAGLAVAAGVGRRRLLPR